MNQDQILYSQILEGREKRAERQQELIRQYNKPLVSFSLNVPGPNKSTSLLEKVHKEGLEILNKKLKENNYLILWQEVSETAAGHQAFLVVEANAGKIKKLTVDIEEQHPLGRIFDFDVFDEKFNQISRTSLGIKERTCLLCKDKVTVCRRSGKHSLKEVLQRIDEISEEYFSSKV